MNGDEIARGPIDVNTNQWQSSTGKSNEIQSIFGFRIHHVIGDGYSMLQFLHQLFDSPQTLKSKREIKLTNNNGFLTQAKIGFWTPFSNFQFLRAFFSHSDYFTRKKSTQRINLSTTSFPLNDLKRVRQILSLKLNTKVSFLTLLMHLIGNSLRKYLVRDIQGLKSGIPLPKEIYIVASIPNSSSEHPQGTFCNHWSHGIYGVPIAEGNGVKRLEKLQINFQTQDEIKASEISSNFSKYSSTMPKVVLEKLCGHNMGTSIGLTNLPGPSQPTYFCGLEILHKYAVLGLQWEHTSKLQLIGWVYTDHFMPNLGTRLICDPAYVGRITFFRLGLVK